MGIKKLSIDLNPDKKLTKLNLSPTGPSKN